MLFSPSQAHSIAKSLSGEVLHFPLPLVRSSPRESFIELADDSVAEKLCFLVPTCHLNIMIRNLRTRKCQTPFFKASQEVSDCYYSG